MNKLLKKLAILGLAATMCVGVGVGLTACGGDPVSYDGEYHYANHWNATSPHYGIKVKVTVKGGKITKVEIVSSDYVEVSDGWPDKAKWNDNIAALLKAYKGKKVEDVKAVKVDIDDKGQPTGVASEDLKIAGATQGSGRLLLAVQAALKNA